MGIPRFSTRLKAYAERSILGSTETPAKEAVAVIDGPGLAHHIYNRTRDQYSGTGCISYAEIAQATASWLTELQSIGYRIEAILFDGALPASKRDIRIQRLQEYILKVRTYKQNLGSSPLILSATRSLPPPTFLVFSVVEELLANPAFAGVTYVVPGEADPYCVAAAQSVRSNGSNETVTIFSDDADLLVYKLDSRTCVAPFRDLSKGSSEAENSTWAGDLYWPAKISERGSRKDLIEPAFFMAEDPHRTLVDAFRKSVASDQADFVQFAGDFQTSTEIVLWQRLRNDSEVKQTMARLDARISELIWGCENDAGGGLRMFLPFLIDDPSRASAWSVGSEVRKLAYSLATLASGVDADVQEYRRSGERLVSTLTESQAMAEIIRQVSELQTYLNRVIPWANEEAKLAESDIWRYVVLQQMLQFLHHEEYTLPSVDDLVRIVTTQEERKWRQIHLSAQYQAAYYSLRTLKQVLRHSMSKVKIELGEELTEKLWEQLAGLPSISEFLSIPESEEKEKEDRQQWKVLISNLLNTFQGSEPEPESKRRKTSKKRKKGGSDGRGALSRNPFALLADE